MSAASAAAVPGDAPVAVPRKSRKKLFVIVAIAGFVLALGGGAAAYIVKKKAHAEGAGAEHDIEATEKVDRTRPPTFVPLDAFVVNLADKDADRFAQIGVTLEIDDAKFADQIKVYMPAIRNGVLMVLAHKTSRELLERTGKEQLAAEILAAAVKPLGFEPPAGPTAKPATKPVAKAEGDATEEEAAAESDAEPGEAVPKKAVAKVEAKGEHNPVRRVHFSNFIIQ